MVTVVGALLNTLEKRARRAGPGDLLCLLLSDTFVAMTGEDFICCGGFVLLNIALNFLDNVERKVSFEEFCRIGCVNVFGFRREMVITQSRAHVFAG